MGRLAVQCVGGHPPPLAISSLFLFLNGLGGLIRAKILILLIALCKIPVLSHIGFLAEEYSYGSVQSFSHFRFWLGLLEVVG